MKGPTKGRCRGPWRHGHLSLLLAFLSACGTEVPEGLGPRDGLLAACPETPNCVNTADRHPDGTEPIILRDASYATWDRVVDIVVSMPRVTVVAEADRYLHVVQRTPVFRFPDDLELLLRLDQELIVRSASRIGGGDLGVNARRVERLRERLADAGLLRESEAGTRGLPPASEPPADPASATGRTQASAPNSGPSG